MKNTQKISLKSAETIEISNSEKHLTKTVKARIDTGASKCSIDVRLAQKLNLGPIIDVSETKNSHGMSIRPVVEATVKLKDKTNTVKFTITDRDNLKYPVLIGRNLLKQGYIVDCTESDE